MDQTLRITEIFRSIQGEGTRAGLPCAFIRLAGCTLHCRYCDTRYAAEEAGSAMRVEQAVRDARAMNTALVCVTGGEPLLQPAAIPLIRSLMDAGHTVVVETNGACDISRVPPGAVRIMDVKCPGSGESASFLPRNLDHLTPEDEVKFVLCGRVDFDWAAAFVRAHDLTRRCAVLFSPAHRFLPPADLAQWILDSGLAVRFQLQLHRILWPDRNRGV